jgi:hypothetical protein
MKKLIVLSLPVIVLALCFSFAGCDSGSSSTEPVFQPLVFKQTLDAGEVEIRLIRDPARAAWTPSSGDHYEIRLNGVIISHGTVTSVSGGNMTFTPDPDSPGPAGSFSGTLSAGALAIPSIPYEGGTLSGFETTPEESPVTVPVTGVSLNPNTLSLNIGGTTALVATVQPANATNQAVTWSSSNTSVATVNTHGVVTALAAGNVTITVTTVDGSRTATCAITVNAGDSPAPSIVGTWVDGHTILTFDADGGFSFTFSSGVMERGTYTASGGVLTTTIMHVFLPEGLWQGGPPGVAAPSGWTTPEAINEFVAAVNAADQFANAQPWPTTDSVPYTLDNNTLIYRMHVFTRQ